MNQVEMNKRAPIKRTITNRTPNRNPKSCQKDKKNTCFYNLPNKSASNPRGQLRGISQCLRLCLFRRRWGGFCCGEMVEGVCVVVLVKGRGFLGCGHGDEGNVLAKVHEERCVFGYSQEQLFSVVAAVAYYSDFLPWCERSEVVRHFPDGSFDAELEIGFKFLVESYMSHVEVKKPTYVKTTASESLLFHHLINIWEFSPGPVPGTCSMYFLVDFKFQLPFYRQMATMFFREVATRLVGSFNDRCRLIYGPEVPVSKYNYEKLDA
ncbi:coenzyme Q-binding protein COQ10-like [Heracleum sosnowskyi]|uniref:Coenzyme Q-binding protein COQ10-like n=1 Tax=Heracleum sosnowskyi TaxID=360622 RepID=A0AAD8N1B8_9APIA|nr:coenzyme Q-binding protein COQ10-like [Heracleum sosnowskyi]